MQSRSQNELYCVHNCKPYTLCENRRCEPQTVHTQPGDVDDISSNTCRSTRTFETGNEVNSKREYGTGRNKYWRL